MDGFVNRAPSATTIQIVYSDQYGKLKVMRKVLKPKQNLCNSRVKVVGIACRSHRQKVHALDL